MLRSKNCLLCGQAIYEPLLKDYEAREKHLLGIVKSSVKEAYDDTEEGATLFAKGLVEKIKDLPRVFDINELDGFYVDKESNKTVHITFEKEDVLVIDIYDTVEAARRPVGEVLDIIEIDLKTGKMRRREEELSE